jgi:hypothetical protein
MKVERDNIFTSSSHFIGFLWVRYLLCIEVRKSEIEMDEIDLMIEVICEESTVETIFPFFRNGIVKVEVYRLYLPERIGLRDISLQPEKWSIESPRMAWTQDESFLLCEKDILDKCWYFRKCMKEWLFTEYMLSCLKKCSRLSDMILIGRTDESSADGRITDYGLEDGIDRSDLSWCILEVNTMFSQLRYRFLSIWVEYEDISDSCIDFKGEEMSSYLMISQCTESYGEFFSSSIESSLESYSHILDKCEILTSDCIESDKLIGFEKYDFRSLVSMRRSSLIEFCSNLIFIGIFDERVDDLRFRHTSILLDSFSDHDHLRVSDRVPHLFKWFSSECF